MFSPQKSPWSGWLQTPRRDQNGPAAPTRRNGEMGGERGKGLAFLDSPSSPRNFSLEKYAGMDKETLCDKISKLQNELFEYQYNMGLLLIEKKDWTSKYEGLRQALAEADDAYRREQAAHLSAVSEVEKREENLRKALGVEKQCVADLEKALREMRSEHAEIKFTADSKLSEAKSLVTSVEEKSLEVEAKLRTVDAKSAELSRKNAEIDRKLEELVAQENSLRRARASFASEREAHETAISKQKDDLREWEQKLREGEERLDEARSLLNQREQRTNENDKIWKQKEKELKDAEKKIDAKKSAISKEEEDISHRLSSLVSMEKEADSKRKSLEVKERQLQELEETLNSREKVEMQKLLDEHNLTLKAKEKEFELEIVQKRKSMEEDLKNMVAEAKKKEAELNHMEEKIHKREQALENKSDKVKTRENDIELKLKALKERDKSLKVEEKNLESERKQIHDDKERLLALKAELEKIRSDIEKEQNKISEDREQLKVTEEERSEYARLQLELKQEIDKHRAQTEQLVEEIEKLKQERLRFEKEWEELDDRSARLKAEFAALFEEREKFEKVKLSEEEKLNNEKIQTESYIKEELDALKIAKESFAANMEHEKSVLAEKLQSEESKLLHDFELRKRELDVEILRKQEEMDNRLHEKEKRFEEERENELKNINYLKEVAHREMEEMKVVRVGIEKEKLEISTNKQHLEAQQTEIRKDIDELVNLSKKLKDQRELFLKEKERFLTFVEKQKSCSTCAEVIREFELSDLQSLNEIDNTVPLLPRTGENYLKEVVHGTSEQAKSESSPGVFKFGSPNSGLTGSMSWLRKCTTIFKFSPGKKVQPAAEELTDNPSLQERINNVESMETLSMAGNEQELSFDMAVDSLDGQISQSNNIIREVEDGKGQSDDEQRSQHSNAKTRQRRPAKRGGHKSYRKSHVKATVINQQARSGEAFAGDGSKHVNGNTRDFGFGTEESRGESEIPRNTRKRNRAHTSRETSELDGGEHSGNSESFTGQKKRRQRNAQPLHISGESRYNLRRPRVAAAIVNNGPSGHSNNKQKDVDGRTSLGPENPISNAPLDNADVLGDSVRDTHDTVPCFGGDGEKGSIRPTRDLLADGPVRNIIRNEDGTQTINHFVGETEISEEVNGTPERARDESIDNLTQVQEEDDDDEEEVEHPGEKSIGKKLWTFLTT